ncbi:protein translocase subunit SecF [[Phormidium] sp. ETS-05]|uniref:protein translocase subunit SecF n=1 Tax=[Phormidium] sp. ETS-05 TaxID=222819 RepID=UPI0018EED6EA|nr:protein translocase subunit SecF [[Phormidium] sp. ETS-05]
MKLNVIKQRSLWWSISAGFILIGLISMVISWAQLGSPLRPSLDFVGGTRLQLELDCTVAGNCDRPIEAATVREVMAAEGHANSSIQVVGEDRHAISIRTSNLDVNQRAKLEAALGEKIGKFDPSKVQIDTVGPTIGRQLFTNGILSLLLSFFGIIVYLSFRFQLDYAFFAIVALLHDVLVTVGAFSILGLTMGVEVDSLFIVALLTIIGFSVNDTVVIYDRVRETLAKEPDRSMNDIVDDAVNQTLTRSINTTLTTLLSLVAIFLFGGETLKLFALALIIGFTAGAYSSIFIASTILAWWRTRPGQLQPQTASGPGSEDVLPDE